MVVADNTTAAVLADLLGVSDRTIRDLATLSGNMWRAYDVAETGRLGCARVLLVRF
jgi:predicted DNA-binding transcriptional regulator YafY